jgi:hypothetical protein
MATNNKIINYTIVEKGIKSQAGRFNWLKCIFCFLSPYNKNKMKNMIIKL